jgi:hypothetical protein
MLIVFAIWAAFGFAYPGTPIPIALNAISKVLCFVAAITLFLPLKETAAFGLGDPRNGMFLRAAHAQLFLGPVNVPQKAMYWWTNSDGASRALSGAHDYVMHFPAGQLPPNHAVLVIGRVLVENDSDVAAYDLSKQIHLARLSGWQP